MLDTKFNDNIILFVLIYVAGMDYNITAPVFNVTISAGATSTSFDIKIIDDVIREDNETFTVAIRLMQSCLSLSLDISSSIVRILDSDGTYIISYRHCLFYISPSKMHND